MSKNDDPIHGTEYDALPSDLESEVLILSSYELKVRCDMEEHL